MASKRELLMAEDVGWTEFLGLVESLTAEQMEEPGYFAEGWSVKDLLGHIGGWQAEAVQVLEQIRMGTYTPRRVDVDVFNKQFYQANKDLPLSVVRAECWSARNRMLEEWNALPELIPDAEEWFVESGPNHYAEHVERLRAWAGELIAR
ncbi:MAG TPA: maleylpyruvate isomerase N-terminal domain-containing protein [Actinomycetota bacterium]